jgi:L-alanine-DL-glutamate epimerase-like enolase superfamily enzyme
MKLELKQVTYSLRRPVITARATMEARQGWQVRFAHDGLVGRGEAFPLHAFGTESVDACRRALESFEPEPIDSIDELPVVLAPLDGTPAARFAVESALLEWLACKRGTPVAPLLGEGRSEERRVGKECRRLCRSRWSPYH